MTVARDAVIRCILYAAKSTEDRRGSIPDQLRECRAAIAGEADRSVLAEYTDEAFSAFTGSRGPGLSEAMRHAEELAHDGATELWVLHSDRLARGDGRSARHAVEVALWALKRDVTVRSVQDPDTFRDLLYAVVTGQRNHEDSRRKGLAVAAGRRRAAERGDYIGYKPDGYAVEVELDEHGAIKRKMVIDPKRREPIAMIFRLALRGKRTGAIANAVNAAGWRTNPYARGLPPDYWTAQRVYDVLKNPRYAGIAVLNGEILARNCWPAYITERQHQKILGLIAQRKPTKKPRQFESYLLARLARCGHCAGALYAVTGNQRRDGSWARRYVCRNHDRARHDGCCRMKTLDAERIEALFITALPTLLVEGADRDDGSERERFEVAEQNADWSSSPERQRLIEAVLSGEDRRIDRAIEGLVERMSPEAAVIRQATTSQRRARQLEALGRFRAWAEQERAGRTEESRAEAYKLNRLLRRWFATVTVLMDDTSIEFVATRRPAAGELPTSAGRAEVQFDRRELSRIAPSTNTPHRKYQGWQAPEIIGALQAWAHAHGRSPTWGEWVKASEFHPQSLTVRRHFGKWSRALRKAGLKPNEPREVSRNWPWTDAEIFAALDRWVEQHGRAPTWSEWLRCAPEHPCTETIREHFGSWRTGLAAAGLLHADESNLRSGI